MICISILSQLNTVLVTGLSKGADYLPYIKPISNIFCLKFILTTPVGEICDANTHPL